MDKQKIITITQNQSMCQQKGIQAEKPLHCDTPQNNSLEKIVIDHLTYKALQAMK